MHLLYLSVERCQRIEAAVEVVAFVGTVSVVESVEAEPAVAEEVVAPSAEAVLPVAEVVVEVAAPFA